MESLLELRVHSPELRLDGKAAFYQFQMLLHEVEAKPPVPLCRSAPKAHAEIAERGMNPI
jgi:hypothetical protein